jgi:predicted DNA-binding transcriptional regulator YafY
MQTIHLSEAWRVHNPRVSKVIERILNLLAFLLTVGRPVSAEEIRFTVAGYDQGEDEAFRRMFERDKGLLRELGISLELQATDAFEVEYGYVVPEGGYELPDPGLTDDERAALWLAAQAVRLGGQPSGPEAIFKLGGVPGAIGGEPLAANLGEEGGLLGDLFTAVVEHRIADFIYRGTARAFKAYGLVHRRGHWYVVGALLNDDIRAFRVDRISGLSLREAVRAFRRPADFDVNRSIPDAPWEAGPEELTAEVTFDAEVAWWARRQMGGNAEITEQADGAIRAKLPVAHVDAFIGWMLGFVDQAEVLSPPELREGLLARVGDIS